MNRLRSFHPALRASVALVVAAVLYASSIAWVTAEDSKPAETKTDTKAKAVQPAAKPQKKKLTGAELYAINCNRCHPERYATEFTSGQWKSIMTHMRVRANIPAAQAKLIVKYLQEDSGN